MTRPQRSAFAAILLSATLLLAACAGPGAIASKPSGSAAGAGAAKAPGVYVGNGDTDASSGKVAIQAMDAMKFAPNSLTKVRAGSSVTVELKNVGALAHNFISPALGVSIAKKVDAGKTDSVTFTAPATAGTYQFWCNEPGHGEAGMVGQVVVQ